MRLAVYGNVIHDTIVHVNGPVRLGNSHNCRTSRRVGGLANTCRAAAPLVDEVVAVTSVGDDDEGAFCLKEMMAYYEVDRMWSSDHTSRAVVLASEGARTGFVEWGACRSRDHWTPAEADWHHVMYLDRLDRAGDLLAKLSSSLWDSPVSADLCDSDSIDESSLRYVDYLFASESTVRPLLGRPFPVRCGVIIHHPGGSYLQDPAGKLLESAVVEAVEELNVVGAGDYFAAGCIANLMRGARANLSAAHAHTLGLLRGQS